MNILDIEMSYYLIYQKTSLRSSIRRDIYTQGIFKEIANVNQTPSRILISYIILYEKPNRFDIFVIPQNM